MFKDVCLLIKRKTDVDDTGNHYSIETVNEVLCNEKEVRQSEFYQSMAVGYKPTLMLEVMDIDYNGEQLIEYDSIRYRVVRTYKKKNERRELVCQGNNLDNKGDY